MRKPGNHYEASLPMARFQLESAIYRMQVRKLDMSTNKISLNHFDPDCYGSLLDAKSYNSVVVSCTLIWPDPYFTPRRCKV